MAQSKYAGYQSARSAIAAGRTSRLYVMWGDPYLTSRLVDMLRERMVAPGAGDFDFAVVDAATTSPADLVPAIRSAPFVSPRRLVVLERVKAFKARGRAQASESDEADETGQGDVDPASPADETSWDYVFSDPPVTSCVVAITDGPPDARLRLTKAVLKRSQFVDCAVSGRDAQALASEVVRETVKDLRLKMGWRQQGLLVSTAGTDFGQLVRELEKIQLYCGDRVVTDEDVLLLAPRTAQADIWQLLDAIEAGKPGEAHRIVKAALARGESPVVLVASLASQVRIMARARERTEAGVPANALPGVLGANRFWVEQSLRRARLFDLNALYRSIRELARIDLGIKTGMVDPEAAVESFVLALCAARGGGVPASGNEKGRGTWPTPN